LEGGHVFCDVLLCGCLLDGRILNSISMGVGRVNNNTIYVAMWFAIAVIGVSLAFLQIEKNRNESEAQLKCMELGGAWSVADPGWRGNACQMPIAKQ